MAQLKNNINPDDIWDTAYTGHNRLCALSIKTTGGDSKKNEIIQICVFPLNHKFELAKDVTPFYADIMPRKSKHYVDHRFIRKNRYEELLNSAYMPQIMAELFDSWMQNKMQLRESKKILPVCYNWAFIRPFIKNWLGHLNFDNYFSHKYRDIMSVALFCNDYNDRLSNDIPYLKTTITTLSKTLHIEYNKHEETILQCKTISEVYQALIKNW